MSTIKDDVSVHDSGLELNEVQRPKEENRQLKLENAKLKSELVAMERKIEYQREVIEKREEDLQAQIKQLNEAQSALEDENIVLRKELQKRDLDGQAKEIVSSVICKSLHETFNEEVADYSKKIKSLEDEVEGLKIEILDQKSKVDDSVSVVEKLMGKCLQLEETNKELERHSERLHLEIDSKEANIKLLHEQLTVCYERLNSKELIIEELLIKKPAKRRGLRRLLCC